MVAVKRPERPDESWRGLCWRGSISNTGRWLNLGEARLTFWGLFQHQTGCRSQDKSWWATATCGSHLIGPLRPAAFRTRPAKMTSGRYFVLQSWHSVTSENVRAPTLRYTPRRVTTLRSWHANSEITALCPFVLPRVTTGGPARSEYATPLKRCEVVITKMLQRRGRRL